MNLSLSNRLLALIRQPNKRNAGKPLRRSAILMLEALEDRLVPASVATLRLPPPVLPLYSFVLNSFQQPVQAGTPITIDVTEVDSNGRQVTSGGVGSAELTVSVGGTTTFSETISLTDGFGQTTLKLHYVGTETIAASYTVNSGYGSGQEAVTISGQTSVFVTAFQSRGPIWAGYAVIGSGTNAAGATWVQPLVTGGNGQMASTWVGIDGAQGNSTVEQIGTVATVVNGQTQYTAWWEFFGDYNQAKGLDGQGNPVQPGPGYYPQDLPSSFKIAPGDTISAFVSFVSTNYVNNMPVNSAFLFQMTDTPANGGAVESWRSTETTTYVVPARQTAEWIVENPMFPQPVANFRSATFTGAWATINGTTGGINSFDHVVALNLLNGSIEANVANNPPNYLTTRGFGEPANGLGSSSFSVIWELTGTVVVRMYSASGSSQGSGVDLAASDLTVNRSLNAIDGAAGKLPEYLDNGLVPVTAAVLAEDSCSLPTSLLTSRYHGGETISPNDAFWADPANRDDFGSVVGA